MKKRINKALAESGIASRRACESLVLQGRVAVNGKIINKLHTEVDLEKDKLTLDGKRITCEERKVYFLFNKPAGYLCTNLVSRHSILHFFSHIKLRLFTAGRLDRDTSGLILVTNDGLFAQRIIHPSFNITKEYVAKTAQDITNDHLALLSKGIHIDGSLIKPVTVKKVRRGTLKVVISEGKKHEVRNLLAEAGLEVLELKRVRVGPFTLNSIPVGGYRELSDKEILPFLEKNCTKTPDASINSEITQKPLP